VIDTLYAGKAVLQTHMRLLLAERYQENQQLDAWRRVLQRAYDDARGLSDIGLRARATCAWAAQFTEREDAARALSAIDEVLPSLLAHPEQTDAIATCLQLESRAAARSGDTSRAVRSAEQAVTLEEQRGATANRLYAAVTTLAFARVAAAQFGAAGVAYGRAAALLEPQGLANTVRHAVLLNNWSAMLQNAGQYVEAERVARQAVEMARRADAENGASLTMLATWASALSATGAFSEAGRAIDESLTKARAAGSVPRLFNTLGQAIVAATESGDLVRANGFLAEARQALPLDASAVTRGTLELVEGRVALARGDAARAADWTRSALDSFSASSPTQASLVPTQTFLARCLNAAGRFSEALSFAERSRATAAARLGDLPHSSVVGTALLEVAAARSGLGDVDGARSAVAEALAHLVPTVSPVAPSTLRAEQLRTTLEARR